MKDFFEIIFSLVAFLVVLIICSLIAYIVVAPMYAECESGNNCYEVRR